MGRAIVRQPRVFLMDEPLSNLDAKLRVSTRTQISRLQRDLGVTTVYVTHDQTEAMTMGDRIAVLKDGLLQQVGPPRDLYDRPINAFVATFIGSPAMNIGTFPLKGDAVQIGEALVPLSRELLDAITPEDEGKLTVGFRPENLEPATAETVGAFPVEVDINEELGSDAYAYGTLKGSDPETTTLQGGALVARVDPRSVPHKGSTVYFVIRNGEQHNFSASSGERLPA
jgi:multiple sugar transport system ATP-binding protein